MSRFIWIPTEIVLYVLAAWFSVQINKNPNGKWFWISYAFSLIPLWMLIARKSQNLLFDGLLYDIILIFTYSSAMMFFTNSFNTLKPIQMVAAILIVVGLLVFKIGGFK